ncbi:MAG: hypothetical protein HFJ30_00660 [Clostridia bacterium]|nr:hypothetical protein [Clostridia bacterium]
MILKCMEKYSEIVLSLFQDMPIGNLQLSLFGTDPKTNQTAHFADITLDQNNKKLKENEIVVNCLYRPALIPQLLELGILKKQTGICVVNFTMYPVYTVDFSKINSRQYSEQELLVA